MTGQGRHRGDGADRHLTTRQPCPAENGAENGRAEPVRADPAADLDRLAGPLRGAGFECVRRGDGGLPRLRVWHPALPGVGESVSVVPGPGPRVTEPWFGCSSGTPLAPCGDPAGAATRVIGLLAPFVPHSNSTRPGPTDDGTTDIPHHDAGETTSPGGPVTGLTTGAGRQAGPLPAARGSAGRRRVVSSA